jgi:hypothetical protein
VFVAVVALMRDLAVVADQNTLYATHANNEGQARGCDNQPPKTPSIYEAINTDQLINWSLP